MYINGEAEEGERMDLRMQTPNVTLIDGN